MKVELRAAKIPKIGWLAIHCWFVVCYPERKDRWEIWQRRSRREPSWGHLHKNLMRHDSGVGEGESWVLAEWQDHQAKALIQTIEKTPETYPHNYRYRYVPGPNSNTYVQWILEQSNIDYPLDKRAIGKNYRSLYRSFYHSCLNHYNHHS